MNLSCFRVYQQRKSVYVCAQQFLQASIIQNLSNDFMLVSKSFQDFFAGYVLSGLGFLGLGYNLQFIEQDFTYLLGGRYIEFFSCQLINFLLNLIHTSGEVLRSFLQSSCVQTYTILLHIVICLVFRPRLCFVLAGRVTQPECDSLYTDQ